MSDNKQLFADTVDRLLAETCGQEVIEAAERGIFPEALWQGLSSLGIPLMLNDEEHGGSGADLEDAAAILAVAGEHAMPGPLLETIVANRILGMADLKPNTNPLAIVIASLDGTDRPPETGPWPIVESRLPCPWLDRCDFALLLAPVPEGTWVAVARPGVTRACRSLSGEPASVVCQGEIAVDEAVLYPSDLVGETLRWMTVLRASQTGGAMADSVRRTIDYALERKQFGKPLAAMQSVQQQIAQAAGEAIAAQTLIDLSILADATPESEPLIRAMTIRCSDAVSLIAKTCHQIHGALGFSREYPLNFRTRRMLGSGSELAVMTEQRRRLGAWLSGAEEPWAMLTAAMEIQTAHRR